MVRDTQADPEAIQFGVMKKALMSVAATAKLQLADLYVWADLCSIPQRNPGVKSLRALRRLAALAAEARAVRCCDVGPLRGSIGTAEVAARLRGERRLYDGVAVDEDVERHPRVASVSGQGDRVCARNYFLVAQLGGREAATGEGNENNEGEASRRAVSCGGESLGKSRHLWVYDTTPIYARESYGLNKMELACLLESYRPLAS